MRELESADRLARFWDGDWNLAGHQFVDIPDSSTLEREGLSFRVPVDHAVVELFRSPMNRVYVTVPRKPFAWVVEGWHTDGIGYTVQATSLDTNRSSYGCGVVSVGDATPCVLERDRH